MDKKSQNTGKLGLLQHNSKLSAFGALVPVLKKRPGDLETPSGQEVPKYRETRASAAQKYKSVKHKICKGFTVVKLCNNLVSQIIIRIKT